jgi:hypothetical protein
LPIPLDRLGAVLRYQTDHDEAERATSCGPRTSRLMVKVLAKESASLRTTALSKRAKLAGINRSAARSPDWCGIASLFFGSVAWQIRWGRRKSKPAPCWSRLDQRPRRSRGVR